MYVHTYVRTYICVHYKSFPDSNGAVIAIVVVIIVLILCACIIMDILFCYCCKRKGRHNQDNGMYAYTYVRMCIYVRTYIRT